MQHDQEAEFRSASQRATTDLVSWIDSHQLPEATRDNGDGTLTVACATVGRNGDVTIERETIPATLQAARDWLGY
ncbi:putative gp43 (plasmid) [Burkholderia gladioli]|uniref:Gp43 n=1 Tax=Burkholderia gladioli TaxID=28095 RepID=A0AAW3FCW8_BURGA|nr:hypothetical protein [Burkholderia gladioli]AJW93651.1 putative gp43 [Burkholderia gladioli]AWY53010.1 hypothetical protein A8H28_17060 [Burkholderia gladioli pv. gladioli]KGC24012.1 putative gp43 protein [Burkholderia gladioli]